MLSDQTQTVPINQPYPRKKYKCHIESAYAFSQVHNPHFSQNVRSLVDAANGTVQVTPVKTSKDGHIIAEVFVRNGLGDISFQEEMLKSGLVYHRQNAGCYNHLSFEEAQKIAIAAKAGVWNQPKSNKLRDAQH